MHRLFYRDAHGATQVPQSPRERNPTEHVEQNPMRHGNAFFKQCALRWPSRSGGHNVQEAAGPHAYNLLLAGKPSAEDDEQVLLDLDRSVVDGIEDAFVPPMDKDLLRMALLRLLRAWCCRHPNGYTQGMNFIAVVLLVVMHHGPTILAEENAFWTFVAIMERHLPMNFLAAPNLAGLQTDVRVFFELFRLYVKPLHDGTHHLAFGDDEWRDILRLVAYKWFVPCYVNAVPLPTLVLFFDGLLFRSRREGTPLGLSSAHLALGLALVHSSLAATNDWIGDSVIKGEETGIIFNEILHGAREATNGVALIRLSERFRVSPRQLVFLRSRLAVEDAAPTRGRVHPQIVAEPELTGVQAAALGLMVARPTETLPVRVLKETLLLALPPAARTDFYWYPRLCSTCAVTFAAMVIWFGRMGMLALCEQRARRVHVRA